MTHILSSISRIKQYLALVVMLALLSSCKMTPSHETSIPYDLINTRLIFWSEQRQSDLASLTHTIRLSRDESFSLYLQKNDGERINIVVSDGPSALGIILPKMDVEEAKAWQLKVTQPQWMVRVYPNLSIELPSTQVRYQRLFQVLKDINEITQRTSPFPDWYTQDINQLWISFSHKAFVSYAYQQRQHVHHTDDGKLIRLTYDPALFEENGLLTFSSMPDSIIGMRGY
jgi:hypothetical protein